MKLVYGILSIVVLMSLLSCGKDEKGSVNLRIKVMYGDKPFRMFEVFPYPVTGEDFRMNRLSFFMSNFTLRSSGGDQNILERVFLIGFQQFWKGVLLDQTNREQMRAECREQLNKTR